MSPIGISPIDNQFGFEYFFLKSVFIRKRLTCYIFELDKQFFNLKMVRQVAKNTTCLEQLKSCFLYLFPYLVMKN